MEKEINAIKKEVKVIKRKIKKEIDKEQSRLSLPITEKKKLALVLSGGVARAIAHIGVLQVLEENNIKPDAIVGTSMGAVIGGIYASGNFKKFTEDIKKMSESKLKSFFFSIKLRRIGIDAVKSYGPFIKQYTGEKKIEDLPISFTAIATDIKTGKEAYLNKGSLAKAILASMSIPVVFNPVKYDDMLLVDGGVIDPLPFEYGRKIARKVIAVDANPIKSLKNEKKTNAFSLLLDSTGIMSETIINLGKILTMQNLEDEKILFLQLETDDRKLFDFYNVQELIDKGRKAAEKDIKKIIELYNDSLIRKFPIP